MNEEIEAHLMKVGDQIEKLQVRIGKYEILFRQLHSSDHLDGSANGEYWRERIKEVLK